MISAIYNYQPALYLYSSLPGSLICCILIFFLFFYSSLKPFKKQTNKKTHASPILIRSSFIYSFIAVQIVINLFLYFKPTHKTTIIFCPVIQILSIFHKKNTLCCSSINIYSFIPGLTHSFIYPIPRIHSITLVIETICWNETVRNHRNVE